MVQYAIYREKRVELEEFITKEIHIWGNYQNIPDSIKKLIDKEFMALGRYGKRINVYTIEERLQTGEL